MQQEAQVRKVVTQGHRLHVALYGPETGPRVVLLHHGLGSIRAWRRQIPTLVEAGYRVAAYDRWGYGRSDHDRLSLGVPHFTDDVLDLEALLDALGWERALLVGHSDGANIALYAAARFPQRVQAVVAVAAHIYVEPHMPASVEAVAERYRRDPAFRQALDRVHQGHGEEVFRRWYTGWMQPALRQWDARPALRGVRCPVLVMQGEADEHATPRQARDLAAALPQSELVLLPEAGHMLPQEHPEAFQAHLLPFLARWAEVKAG